MTMTMVQVLLMRRDYSEEERNVFKPAEWRWSVPQVPSSSSSLSYSSSSPLSYSSSSSACLVDVDRPP